MNSSERRPPAARTGKRYTNFEDLLSGSGVSEEVKGRVRESLSQTRVASQLARLRQKAGLSQSEMGGLIGKTQSAISKLETGPDDGITIAEIKAYSEATGQRIGIMFGKPFNHAEAIRHHALAMRARMIELAKLANSDNDLEREIAAFFGEAFFNLLSIMTECSGKLPAGTETGVEIRMETYEKQAGRKATEMPTKDLAVV